MKYATISADIVDSTKLSTNDILRVNNLLCGFLNPMEKVSKGSWGRVVRGDGFECVLDRPCDLLRVALMLKCYVKMFDPELPNLEFARYGIRMAMAIGELRTNDQTLGIIDGEAIYLSGRAIEGRHPNARGTMMLCYEGKEAESLAAIVGLCDTIVNKSTAKQCEVLFNKLCGTDEGELAGVLGKSRPTVNKHSQKAGWPAIERAVRYFESIKF